MRLRLVRDNILNREISKISGAQRPRSLVSLFFNFIKLCEL